MAWPDFRTDSADVPCIPIATRSRFLATTNGKVERSHRTDKGEFDQLLTYKDDVDLEKKLAVWERFYTFDRPHGAHGGKTPYEALREKRS